MYKYYIMNKLTEDEFLIKCLELLDYFQIDYKGKIMFITDGGNSIILNPNSQFYEVFGGYSINSIVEFVAKKLNKKIKFKN